MNKKTLFFIFLSTIVFCNFSVASIPRFSEFENLTSSAYIDKTLPQLDENQKKEIVTIFEKISQLRASPIQEDDGQMDMNNPTKLLQESGYSYPPLMSIQGPFLYLCGRPNIINIMDLGAGNGPDTMMILAIGKSVISFDIHKKQLNSLRETVGKLFQDNKMIEGKFKPFQYNFVKKQVPEKFYEGFDLININKVFHFLNDQDTKNIVDRIYNLAKPGGYVCITTMTLKPNSFEFDEFERQKHLQKSTPGLIFYDTSSPRYNLDDKKITIVSDDTMKRENGNFISPGNKREFIEKDKYILRQGRHFHTYETLMPYLKGFHILDHYVTIHDECFLSVLIQKPVHAIG